MYSLYSYKYYCSIISSFLYFTSFFLPFHFFFFKQKTAYEMLIRDCSSDVCSSDLHELDSLIVYHAPVRLAPVVDVGDRILEGGPRDAEGVRRDARARLVQGAEEDLQAFAGPADQVAARHAAALERDRGGARAAMAHLVLLAQDREAGRVLLRSAERRVGKEGVSTVRSRWGPY